MGLGQTLLTIMSLMMMGSLILSFNTMTFNTGLAKDLAEYRIAAASEAISILERAEGLAFDEYSYTRDLTSLDSLSTRLGRDSGEDSTNQLTFDDVDDYYGFRDTIQVNGIPYKVETTVEYDTLNRVAGTIDKCPPGTRSWFKKITVYVTGPHLLNFSKQDEKGPIPDTVKLERLVGFWSFQ